MHRLKIDFISDVTCPWCMIGLRGLQEALERTSGLIQADLVFQPFELNPKMPAEGQVSLEHVAEKYGSSAEQVAAIGKQVSARATEAGLAFNMTGQDRIYNTFDAHRLLHWARTKNHQEAMKQALFKANFADCANISDPEVLVSISSEVGLDVSEAKEILSSNRYAQDVRDAQRLWASRGISSVPTIVINDKWMISGAQPVDVFEQTLRTIISELTAVPDRYV